MPRSLSRGDEGGGCGGVNRIPFRRAGTYGGAVASERTRTTTEVIHDHLSKRLQGRVDDDVRENYAEDVVMLTGSGDYHGHDGVRMAAEELQRLVGEAEYTYDQTVINGEYGMLEWSARAEGTVVSDGADSFVVRDGRIVMQTVHYSPIPR